MFHCDFKSAKDHGLFDEIKYKVIRFIDEDKYDFMDFEVITTDEDRECIEDKGYMNVIRVRFELEGKTYTHLNYYNTSSGFAYFITEGVMWEEEYETEDEDEDTEGKRWCECGEHYADKEDFWDDVFADCKNCCSEKEYLEQTGQEVEKKKKKVKLIIVD